MQVINVPMFAPTANQNGAAPQSGQGVAQEAGDGFRNLLLEALLGKSAPTVPVLNPQVQVGQAAVAAGQQAVRPAEPGSIPATASLPAEAAAAGLLAQLISGTPVQPDHAVPIAPAKPEDPPQGPQTDAVALMNGMALAAGMLTVQAPTQPQVTPQTQASSQSPMASPVELPADVDPLLQRFVQEAVQSVQAPAQAAVAQNAAAQAQSGPTFADLVALMAGQEQPGQVTVPGQPAARPVEQAQVAKPAAPAVAGQPVVQAPAETARQNQTGTQAQPQTAQPQAPASAQTTAPGAPAPEAQPVQSEALKASKAEPVRAEKERPVNAEPVAVAHTSPRVTEARIESPQAPVEAPRSPADPDSVLRQVGQSLKVMLDGKRSEVRMQLNPEHLGTVSVKLVLSEGTVRAHLTTSDQTVKAVLEANLTQLKDRLTDQGFKVEQVHIAMGSDTQSGQSHQSREGDQRQPGQQPFRQRFAKAEEEPADPGRPAIPQTVARGTWIRGAGSRLNSLA